MNKEMSSEFLTLQLECTAVAVIWLRMRMRMRNMTRSENSLANVGHQISKKNCELSAANESASGCEWFANEIVKLVFSLQKSLRMDVCDKIR